MSVAFCTAPSCSPNLVIVACRTTSQQLIQATTCTESGSAVCSGSLPPGQPNCPGIYCTGGEGGQCLSSLVQATATPTPTTNSGILQQASNPADSGSSASTALTTSSGKTLSSTAISGNGAETVTGTPTPSSSSTSIPKSDGGVKAGIAIGCLLGGALLAGLIFFFLFRRKNRKSTNQRLPVHVAPVGAAGYPQKERALETVVPVNNGIEKYLPQPVEDNKITGDLSKLRDNIKNHGQSYYHTLPVDGNKLNDASIIPIAAILGTSSQTLKGMLVDPSMRITAIRAGIAVILFSRFSGPRSVGGDTILPPEIATVADSLPNLGSSEQVKLLSKSKVINGAIFQQQNKFTGETAGGDRAVRAINDFVAPFVQSNDESRVKNLQSIVRRASQFAVLLYSQPSLWKFDWAANNSTSGGIVVVPALVQTVNDESEVLTPNRVFCPEERV